MKSIAFFNNKGGVGKTTLTCNLASYIQISLNKRVLLVDADPQCNATQAVLDDSMCEEIYLSSSKKIDTLYSCLCPLEDGEPTIRKDIKPVAWSTNKYRIDIIPGHPNMSIIEDTLSEGWNSLKGRDVRGFRITNWSHHLIDHFSKDYDYIFFDVGPSLGALNRSVILSCDYIVTPFGCDIFSLLGIKNIASWIKSWKEQYDSASREAREKNPGKLESYSVILDTDSRFRFAGYSVQQYVSRKFKSGNRPVKSYDRIMQDIPGTVTSSMKFLAQGLSEESFELGHIPYLYSLIPMSQASRTPIHQLKSTDGLVGSQYNQASSYSDLMESISKKLLANTGDIT